MKVYLPSIVFEWDFDNCHTQILGAYSSNTSAENALWKFIHSNYPTWDEEEWDAFFDDWCYVEELEVQE